MCWCVYGSRLSLHKWLQKADQPHQRFPAQLTAWVMHQTAGKASPSDGDGTYLWVGHSRIHVDKTARDSSSLSQLIRGQ